MRLRPGQDSADYKKFKDTDAVYVPKGCLLTRPGGHRPPYGDQESTLAAPRHPSCRLARPDTHGGMCGHSEARHRAGSAVPAVGSAAVAMQGSVRRAAVGICDGSTFETATRSGAVAIERATSQLGRQVRS